jgi:hypothetical protein
VLTLWEGSDSRSSGRHALAAELALRCAPAIKKLRESVSLNTLTACMSVLLSKMGCTAWWLNWRVALL